MDVVMPKHGEPHTKMEQTILDNVKSANPHLLDVNGTVDESAYNVIYNRGIWTVNVSGGTKNSEGSVRRRLFARFEWSQTGHNPFHNHFQAGLYCLECGSNDVNEGRSGQYTDYECWDNSCNDCSNGDGDLI